jgi:hypothetical protein
MSAIRKQEHQKQNNSRNSNRTNQQFSARSVHQPADATCNPMNALHPMRERRASEPHEHCPANQAIGQEGGRGGNRNPRCCPFLAGG